MYDSSQAGKNNNIALSETPPSQQLLVCICLLFEKNDVTEAQLFSQPYEESYGTFSFVL